MKAIGVALGLFGMSAFSSAHFIWAELAQDGPRNLSICLAEVPGDDVLPVMARLTPKIKFLSGKVSPLPSTPTSAVYGSPQQGVPAMILIPYGVVDRGGEIYGLEYFAKAAARPRDAAIAVGKGFELVATLSDNTWTVKAMLDGKLAADAEIITVRNGEEVKTKAGEPLTVEVGETATAIPVRAVRTADRGGKDGERTYKTTRQWTSLMLPMTSRVPEGSDLTAYRALELASDGRESLRKGSAPWKTTFRATNGQDALDGTIAWDGTKVDIVINAPESSYVTHVRGQLTSLFMHRIGRRFWEGDGTKPISWGNDENQLGAKILVKDTFNSSYRVLNGQVRQVVRDFKEERLRLDITKLIETEPGRYLSGEFLSVSEDLKTGASIQELVYKDEFQKVGQEWLPKKRTVTGNAKGSKFFMQVTFGKYTP